MAINRLGNHTGKKKHTTLSKVIHDHPSVVPGVVKVFKAHLDKCFVMLTHKYLDLPSKNEPRQTQKYCNGLYGD